jgi:hypothetical protein
LSEAKALDIITSRDAKDMLGIVQEAQLEANVAVLDRLNYFENEDHCHFGKVRIAMEKRLKE